MWKDFLKNTVLKPGLKRLGTVGAVLLVAGGDWLCTNLDACGLVTASGAQVVVNYVIACALLCVDLAFEWLERVKK